MSAISTGLLKTIRELQSLESIQDAALGGGTNLAIRYGQSKFYFRQKPIKTSLIWMEK